MKQSNNNWRLTFYWLWINQRAGVANSGPQDPLSYRNTPEQANQAMVLNSGPGAPPLQKKKERKRKEKKKIRNR